MVEIIEEIQCYADPQRVCPLKAAKYAVEGLFGTLAHASGAFEQGDVAVQGIARELSGADESRFYGILGDNVARMDIEPETCVQGPSRSLVVVGRMTCNAKLQSVRW